MHVRLWAHSYLNRALPIPLDIKPVDIFFWGFVKDIVYRRKVSNVHVLKARITATITSVYADMLARTWREIDHHLDTFRETNGTHVRVY